MDAAGLRVDMLRQRVGIGAFELSELPPVEEFRRQPPLSLGQLLAPDQIFQHFAAANVPEPSSLGLAALGLAALGLLVRRRRT